MNHGKIKNNLLSKISINDFKLNVFLIYNLRACIYYVSSLLHYIYICLYINIYDFLIANVISCTFLEILKKVLK